MLSQSYCLTSNSELKYLKMNFNALDDVSDIHKSFILCHLLDDSYLTSLKRFFVIADL